MNKFSTQSSQEAGLIVTGQLTGHRDGFGFVIRDEQSAAGADVFLPLRELRSAIHGDTLRVKITGLDNKGRPEGVVLEVIARKTSKIVGRLVAKNGLNKGFAVAPEDQRIRHDIAVNSKHLGGAQLGQVVVVELTNPIAESDFSGKIIEVLGNIDDPGMEIEIAVRKFEVPRDFSENALAQARALPSEVLASEMRGRVDLRDVPLVTIDGEDARDFDDAVYCEPNADGNGFRLIVAIADVAHYVTDGSALDLDAVERSTSVYFPRKVIPMLPEKISNGLCSLNPEVDRLCMVCDAMIDASGKVTAYQFYTAVMHSHCRLTYNQAWDALSSPKSAIAKGRPDLLPHLQHLYALFQTLLNTRKDRGAIEFETVETKFELDAAGRVEKIVPFTRNDAHRVIEECMLLANVCAADLIERSKQPALFRVHEGPTPPKLAALREFLKANSLHLGGGNEPSPQDYAQLMAQINQKPNHQALQSTVLRSMQQAHYSPDNAGHFGLAYEAYAHFTSPIRRYPDLLVHRAIKAIIAGSRYIPSGLQGNLQKGSKLSKAAKLENQDAEHAYWDRLGIQTSACERRADDASRDVVSWLKCYLMQNFVGETFSGVISSVAPFGLFVTLDDMYVEGLIHITELNGEYYQYLEALGELRGSRTGIRYTLGQRVEVQLTRVDIESRRIELRLQKEGSPKIAPVLGLPPKTERKKAAKAAREFSNPKQAAPPNKKPSKKAAKRPAKKGGKAKGKPTK